MVWVFGMMFGGGLVSVVSGLTYFIAYERSFAVGEDSGDANSAAALSNFNDLNEWGMYELVELTVFAMTLLYGMQDWIYA